jgi:hypothetical protein
MEIKQSICFSIQYSVHLPSSYICTSQARLLPDWTCPVSSVLVILQRSPTFLLDRTTETEACKSQLRQQFIELGKHITQTLQQITHLAAVFDPCTGLPLGSLAGELRLDDVAVVRSLLGYAIATIGGCSIVIHPEWGSAVYPSVLLSSASPETLEIAVKTVFLQHQLTLKLDWVASVGHDFTGDFRGCLKSQDCYPNRPPTPQNWGTPESKSPNFGGFRGRFQSI